MRGKPCSGSACPILRRKADGRSREADGSFRGLPSRRQTITEIEQMSRRSKRVLVMAFSLAQIDALAAVDADVGDLALQSAAQRAQVAVGRDGVVGRLFGSQIIAAHPLTDGPAINSKAAAEAFRVAVQGAVPARGTDAIILSAAVGAACWPEHGASIQAVVQAAATALHSAIESGDARAVHVGAASTSDLVAMLRRDLPFAAERGHLMLAFQPQVDLALRRLVGFEALARYRHPDLGIVPPVTFIAVAEEHGIISTIDRFVARKAASFAALASALKKPVPIAINASACDVCSPSYADHLLAIIAETGARPEMIHVEITETAVVTDPDAAAATFARLRGAGVKVAIDDFGVGTSSLALLRRLPVDTLKLDRSFLTDCPPGSAAAAVVSGAVRMAHALSLTIIAEGVETEQQADVLVSAECDQGQGWLFGHPLSENDAIVRLAA